MGWIIIIGIVLWIIYEANNDSSSNNSTINSKATSYPHRTPSDSSSNWTRPISGGALNDGPWQEIRKQVFSRDGYKCVSCGSTTNLTVDHIQQVSVGGSNDLINLRTLCADCHETRHGRRFLDRAFDADPNYGSNLKHNAKLKAINDAIQSGDGVGVKYIDREGLYSERVIYPKKVYKSRHVYVDAYCELDKAKRTFRLSRMRICNTRLNFYDNPTNSYTSSPYTGGTWRSG